jgi:hypothetical protein
MISKLQKWQPLKVVCINSDSKGSRLKKLAVACYELDLKLAKIFKIEIESRHEK